LADQYALFIVGFGIDKIGGGVSASMEKYSSIMFPIIGKFQSIKNIIH